MLGDERAPLANVIGARRQHEVIDGELAAAMKQIGKGALAIRSLEDVGLLDFHPWQMAALLSKLVELVRHLFLFDEQSPARGEPFLARDDFRWGEGACCHVQDSSACGVLNVGLRRRFLAFATLMRLAMLRCSSFFS